MGRKKRNRAQLKPFCFYCEREFDDEKVLIQHQKAKHFKCSACNRKLDTATGLVVHMLQVHKETISRVPNSNNGRDNPDLIIHGMDGVPIELLNEKQAKLDEERGAVRHSKSAHTTVGMSIMSGFFNQIQQTHPQGMMMPGMGPGMMIPPQVGAMNQLGPGGQLNPFAMNQFMAHMQHGPQAAFTAMFGLPAPKIEGLAPSIASTAPSAIGPTLSPTGLLQSGSIPSVMGFSASHPSALSNAPSSGFIGLNLTPQLPSSTTAITETPAIASRLPGVLSSTLAAVTAKAGGQLIFDPSDDAMSPEEIRAQQPQYAHYLSLPVKVEA